MTRKSGCGLSPSFLQEDISSKEGYIESCGKTKEAVLQGNPKYPNILASTVYETKPVHYLSMVSYNLKWFVT